MRVVGNFLKMSYYPNDGFTLFARNQSEKIDIQKLISSLKTAEIIGDLVHEENGIYSFNHGAKSHEILNFDDGVFTYISNIPHHEEGIDVDGKTIWNKFPYHYHKRIVVGNSIMVNVLDEDGMDTDILEKNTVIAIENCGAEIFANEKTLKALKNITDIDFEIDISQLYH